MVAVHPRDIRPHKDQPFYHHLLAENADSEYVAYVSEQNLELDPSDEPMRHPQLAEALAEDGAGGWQVRPSLPELKEVRARLRAARAPH